MKIYETGERSAPLVQDLLEVWEKSVRATHLFLSEEEVKKIKPYVPQAVMGVAHLLVAEDETGTPVAFMGVEDGSLEMLFIAPPFFSGCCTSREGRTTRRAAAEAEHRTITNAAARNSRCGLPSGRRRFSVWGRGNLRGRVRPAAGPVSLPGGSGGRG